MRVLHVIDAGRSPRREFSHPGIHGGLDDRLWSCRTLTRLLHGKHDHRVVILGTAAAATRARELDLAIHGLIPHALGISRLAAGPVSRLVRAVRPDIVHWWDHSWSGGSFGRPGRAWRLEAVCGFTPRHLPLWLCGGGALVSGPAERASASALGLTPIEVPPPVVEPPSSMSAGAPSSRQSCLLLLGPISEARQFQFLCGLISVIGTHVRGVVPATSGSQARARRFRRAFQNRIPTTTTHLPRVSTLAECRLAVWMGEGPAPATAIRSTLAAGVPVVVPGHGAWTIPSAARPALVALNATHVELARKVMALLDDPSELRRAGALARIDAQSENLAFARTVDDAYEGRAAPAAAPLESWTSEQVGSPAA